MRNAMATHDAVFMRKCSMSDAAEGHMLELAWRSIRVWLVNAMLFVLAGAVGVFAACWYVKVFLS